MALEEQITQLDDHVRIIEQIISRVPAAYATWQPDPNTWSFAAVMDHLYHEERADFRAWLAAGLGLPDPGEPQQTDLPYAPDDLPAIWVAFLVERERSLAWLRGLRSPDWAAPCSTNGGRQISAGDMLVSWVAHDVLHLRQLVELLYAYTVHRAQPYSTRYAGEW